MNRRQYLAGLGAGTAGTLAGCTDLFARQSTRAPPLVEDRPDAVYVPTHVEGMEMVGMETVDRYSLALFYSFPHRFWLMDGDETNRVEIRDEDAMHLMAAVWDEETRVAIPSGNASFTVQTEGGDTVVQKRMWPMLSQNMGFHYGDNVQLDGEGVYEVTVQFGPVVADTTGDFSDAFGEQVAPTFRFEFSQDVLDQVMFERLEDRQGERDAVDPMEMDMVPTPRLPPADEMPGTPLGEGESGDATVVLTLFDDPPAGIEGDGQYLAVSPRTPYNRFPIPFMGLSATVERDGETVHQGTLTDALDPDLQYHYGAVVDGVEDGDEVTVGVDTPPQVSRHEGYETAFLDTDPVEITAEL